ncbi:MAG: 3-oxoacyl-[acyl-carrier-protein] synthase III C-terminal domain-containing protein, partial [Nanoarchaeota archaeon]|nr:3-oxoacyl-[acyl-carrier-protein] synthase III C-terminal domain-containing protein [Nanoarchaeota archaeon]
KNKGILAEYSKSNPFDGRDYWIFRDRSGYLRMPEGSNVLKEAVREMLESVRVLKKETGWDRAEVYIPHQANGRIIAGIEARISEEGAIVFKNIESYGNMSSATCAIALDEALREGVIKKGIDGTVGSRVIITSFGSGLVTSAVAIQF